MEILTKGNHFKETTSQWVEKTFGKTKEATRNEQNHGNHEKNKGEIEKTGDQHSVKEKPAIQAENSNNTNNNFGMDMQEQHFRFLENQTQNLNSSELGESIHSGKEKKNIPKAVVIQDFQQQDCNMFPIIQDISNESSDEKDEEEISILNNEFIDGIWKYGHDNLKKDRSLGNVEEQGDTEEEDIGPVHALNDEKSKEANDNMNLGFQNDRDTNYAYCNTNNSTLMEVLEPASPPQYPSHNHHIETGEPRDSTIKSHHGEEKKAGMTYWVLLLINYLSMAVGSISSSLLSRFYFIHGGSSRWLSTLVQSAGFPLLLLSIYLRPFLNITERRPFSEFTSKLLLQSVLIGLMLGINNLLFSSGVSYLPVSTSSLLLSSQLTFTLLLSVILVKQKVTFLNLTCVILLTSSSIILALDSSHDRPIGVSQTHYFMGFFSILGAGMLFALYLPTMQIVYEKVDCYEMVMEIQLVMEMTATVLAAIGMASDGHGYGEIIKESRIGFDLGPVKYWLTVGVTLVSWQLCFVGTAGIVYLTTSLTGGICTTALIPMNVLGGFFTFGDEFGGIKVVSTVMCVVGFCFHLYGEYVRAKEEEEEEDQALLLHTLNSIADIASID
ncbi:hypothetical protein HHK36_004614 [Tetracentron sinense]|uniref:Purine permease n=1 Tax=Tetracentron sinense TaxID=13715 RepID=A0A834ZK89_TETSI|nr:hypothetical protein HHK36_004614 [Tetracentron sinense]